jgi:8-oxo-dGTP pyrophosphatase MutT (NUDIX family)
MSGPEYIIPFDELPERFARAIRHPPSKPATPRPAATVVLMRDGQDGPEILLLRRSSRSRFVPGAYVFPGGRVDASDATPDIMDHLDGLDEAQASRRLDLTDGDPPALAYYLAAMREAFEETGILLGKRASDGGPAPTAAEVEDFDVLRNDLMEERRGFAAVLEEMDVRLDGGAMEYLAHWITPEPEPRRYDTRFFAARVPRQSEAIIDRREMTDALWITPSAALRQHSQGDLPMIFPTMKTLEQLTRYSSVEGALKEIGSMEVPTILPRLVITPEGVAMDLG